MQSLRGVFATDGVNRADMLLPLSVIVESIESHVAGCAASGRPVGLPSNISHDSCRPIGWCVSKSVLVTQGVARQLGAILTPETPEDIEKIETAITIFRRWSRNDGVAPYADDLRTRTADLEGPRTGFLYLEGAAIARPGLAAQAFPDLFAGGAYADKDGLTDYAELLARTRQVVPGVFHDPKRDVVLYAHRFFRRSLSHLNSLNSYFFDSFDPLAKSTGVRGRLRLDPDLLGHPDSVRETIECEYWRGPKFEDDVAAIKDGVAVHAADDRQRLYEALDRTEIWWKAPEERVEARSPRTIRTLEVEEVVDQSAGGLDDDCYGCRYAHAEYDVASGVISHFDGAIRAYAGEAYLRRLDVSIDRAGKHSDYTKLFRLDGAVAVGDWKRVLSDYYRGNNLIPEYLGAPEDAVLAQADSVGEAALAPARPALSALLSLDLPGDVDEEEPGPRLIIGDLREIGGQLLPCAEVGPGRLAKVMSGWTDEDRNGTFTVEEPNANLSTIHLGGDPRPVWAGVVTDLAEALEAEASTLSRVSVAFEWLWSGLQTTLSVEGETRLVAELLRRTVEIVDPTVSPSAWVEPFRAVLWDVAPDLTAPVDWPPSAMSFKRLHCERSDRIAFRMKVPERFWPLAEAEAAAQASDVETQDAD